MKKTKTVLIFGYPLKKTLSPLFQNRGFRALGLDWRYEACPVEPARFKDLAERWMKDPAFAGANVTIPHKQASLKLKGVKATARARAIGAANTLFRRGRAWFADNTDAAGFLAAAGTGHPFKGREVLLVGTGGSARAAAYACLKDGATRLWVSSRSRDRAKAFCRSLSVGQKRSSPVGEMNAMDFQRAMQRSAWVVNTVPEDAYQGSLWALAKKCKPCPKIFDLSYYRSPLGLKMLFEQGVESFGLWTGKRAPRRAMWEILSKEVKKNPAK
jgi:shikimate dehydrogenase